MRPTQLTYAAVILICFSAFAPVKDQPSSLAVREGDIVFQTSLSVQSTAIQLATKSQYSHMGLVLFRKGKPYVFEAVQPVKYSPLDQWIKRGKHQHCVVKRLKNAKTILTPTAIQAIRKVAHSFEGKLYDGVFNWSDDRIYCSELVWKVFQRALGLQIGKLQHLRDFDLSSKTVQQKLKERYGRAVPLSETVVSPQAIFDSELLETVKVIN